MENYDEEIRSTVAILQCHKNANKQFSEIFAEYGLDRLTRVTSAIEVRLTWYALSTNLTGAQAAQKLMRGDLA